MIACTRVAMCAAAALALTVTAAATAARAGDLSVTVRDLRGAGVADAVVTVQYPGGKAPAHYAQPLRMSQRNLMFEPFVLAVPVGASVGFANQDTVRHQIYSFSPAKKFELKLFGKDQTHAVRFDKAGVVALGCNIHDNMIAFIKVLDAPVAAVTDGSGHVDLHGLPAGAVTVKVWQPYLRAPANELQAQVVIPETGTVVRGFSAVVTPPPKGAM